MATAAHAENGVLPMAGKPEDVGLSSAAAQAPRGGDAEARRLRPGAGRRHAGGAARQDRVGVDARQARRGGGRCDEARRDLPHLLHDQADRQRRDHADGRGGQAAGQRPRVEVPARDRQDEGRHREGRRWPAGPAAQRSRAAHDGAGSAAPHVRPHLRHARHGAGQPDPTSTPRSAIAA